MSTYIFGHTNPDSDSIVGAISLSYLKNKLGEQTIPSRQGEISPETKFILDKFSVQTPMLKTSYADEDVYLVDFSDKAQAPKDIEKATILGIVDHHKLGDLTTDTPLECWIRPIGCSNSVIYEMFVSHNVEIPKDIAGIMMCAILSDTVIFKSPTCTKADTKAVKALASIAGVEDYKALAMEMFIVKSDVGSATPRELTTRDYKEFEMGNHKVGIGQLEVVDLSIFDDKKEIILQDMQKLKDEGNLHSVLILLTDIIKEGSMLLCLSDDTSKIQTAFDAQLTNNEMWLDGVLSRKKQVVPFLLPLF